MGTRYGICKVTQHCECYSFPIHLNNHIAGPSSSSQQPRAVSDEFHFSLPANHVTVLRSSSQHPRAPLSSFKPPLPGNTASGMGFSMDNTTAHMYRHSAEVTVHESAARKRLMSEVAKLEQAFDPDHAQQLAQLSACGVAHRAFSEPAMLRDAMEPGTLDPMQDILSTAMKWQLHGGHQQTRRPRPRSLQPACHSHKVAHSHPLQIPVLDCSQQGMALCPGGFQGTPMQRRNEHVGGNSTIATTSQVTAHRCFL